MDKVIISFGNEQIIRTVNEFCLPKIPRNTEKRGILAHEISKIFLNTTDPWYGGMISQALKKCIDLVSRYLFISFHCIYTLASIF